MENLNPILAPFDLFITNDSVEYHLNDTNKNLLSVPESIKWALTGQKLITLRTSNEFILEAKEALRKSSHKLPTPCNIVVNQK